MKHIVALTGAGISAESGIKTFRDAGGLWEGHDVTQVASPQGWDANPALVLEFYNQRRKQALTAEPNNGHRILAELEKNFKITVITQNVDNLHEKAGSTRIIHLHGELFKSRSTVDDSLVYDIKAWALNLGDLCEKGSQLRPHIVWFGEMVPMMAEAVHVTRKADIFLVIGTSLVVYPAAGLVDEVADHVPVFVVDPNLPSVRSRPNLMMIGEKASQGMKIVKQQLLEKYL